MKKPLILVLVLILCISLASCQSQEKIVEGTCDCTQEAGVLKVGMDLQYPPFETFDDNNEPMGISVDVAQGLADSLGIELEVVNMDFGTLVPALDTGKIDIAIASMSITAEREEKVDFTNPYFYFKIIGLMNKDYAQANSLTGASTQDELWAIVDTKFIGLVGQISTSIPEDNGFVVEQSVDRSAAITEVATGRADVIIISPEIVVDAHAAYPDTTVVLRTSVDVSPIGMAVTEGNTKLLDLANKYIDNLDKDGGVYDDLRKKYLSIMQDKFGEDATLDYYIYED